MTHPTPRPHQVEALAAADAALEARDRTQLILACGTGKTLVGRWLAEQRAAATTLVCVPSLALIAQTLREWRAAGPWQFEALVICSDPSTAAGEQERAAADGADIPAPFWTSHRAKVTTSVRETSSALSGRHPDRPLVVFSTYHSAAVAAAAARGTATTFDLVLADEAHHLAGHPRTDFRVVLDDDQIPAAARVFMTATQVTATAQPSLCGWDDWCAPVSMADTDLFGEVAYRLDFAAAIDQQLLTDYDVVIYETPGQVAPDPVAALVSAAAEGLSRVLTFHGRVSKARAFADTVDGARLPDGRTVRAVSVAGTDPAIHRAQSLQLLENPDPDTFVVVSSARCLAEGVDVPAVDGVLFADPRSSDVGIIQAVGRALRRAPGKRTGKILIPVCCNTDLDDDTTLSTGDFAAIWRILRALRSLDPRLSIALEHLTRAPSRRGRPTGENVSRVRFELPSLDGLHDLVARLVADTSTAWDERFAELEALVVEHGSANPPSTNKRLVAWCESQRRAYRRGMILPDRSAALRSLPGWTWDAQMRDWVEQFKEVYATIPPGGRLDVDNPDTMKLRLRTPSGRNRARTVGRWCAWQRILARRGDLDPSRREYLAKMPGWTYQALTAGDAACVDLLAEYVAWKGDANPPADYVDDDLELGAWLTQLRRAKALGRLSQSLRDEVEAATPTTDGKLRWETRDFQWSIGLEALRQYVDREGRCRLPDQHLEQFEGIDYPLSVWCRNQRHDHRYGNLAEHRVAALEAIPGWLWEIQPTERISIDIGDARHGTRTGYVKGCRCEPCTEANRRDHADRTRRARAGGPSTDLVSAARARGHLRILTARGATQKGLARAADLNVQTIVGILDGVRTRILPATEQIVLGLTHEQVQRAAAPGTTIPAGPTWELLDDLIARGWPKSWIARECGFGRTLQLSREQVTAGNAAQVAALHARVADLTPPARRHRAPMPPLTDILADQQRSA